MISLKRTRLVDATPEEIFAALADPTQLQQLLPRVQRVEVLEQHADHARLATHMAIGNGLGTIRCEGELRWTEPTHISFTVRKPLPVENVWHLKPVSGGTEISVTMSLDLSPMLGPFAKFVPANTVTDMLSQDLDTMLSGMSRFATSGRRQQRVVSV